jgi:hypothetical protein
MLAIGTFSLVFQSSNLGFNKQVTLGYWYNYGYAY